MANESFTDRVYERMNERTYWLLVIACCSFCCLRFMNMCSFDAELSHAAYNVAKIDMVEPIK